MELRQLCSALLIERLLVDWNDRTSLGNVVVFGLFALSLSTLAILFFKGRKFTRLNGWTTTLQISHVNGLEKPNTLQCTWNPKDNRMFPASNNIVQALPIKPDVAVLTTFARVLTTISGCLQQKNMIQAVGPPSIMQRIFTQNIP